VQKGVGTRSHPTNPWLYSQLFLNHYSTEPHFRDYKSHKLMPAFLALFK